MGAYYTILVRFCRIKLAIDRVAAILDVHLRGVRTGDRSGFASREACAERPCAFCFIGPNLGCYTATHALDVERRNAGIEKALPITIGDNCWLGGDVKILPGVTIGEGSVIGAGSVVTKDVPPHVVAAGNPCRVLRSLRDRL